MNFPLQQDVRRRPKTPLIKFKKEREGANNECKAKLPSEGGGGIFFLCFFLCSKSCLQCNAHLLKAM